jgi:hypothetical protein
MLIYCAKRGALTKRVLILLAGLLCLGGAIVPAITSAAPALANGSGNQICTVGYAYCLNAWNGGPWIKSYSYSAQNNDFTFVNDIHECNGGITTSTCPGHGIAAGQGIGGLQFTGGGSWNGQCIADAYNDTGDARAALNTGCPISNTGANGSNFVWVTQNTCGSAVALLYDIHWNGYIRVNESNGVQQYLNNASGSCMKVLPPA